MKILLIDTCGAIGSVALASDGEVLAVVELPGRTASERLVSAIRDLAGANPPSLGAVVVVHGPGSFTGVRVGLSAAKGLCEALHLPLIAISRLAVLAHLAQAPAGVRVHALLDAGRDEFYHGEYLDGTCLRESLLTRDELAAVLSAESAPSVVVCESVVVNALAPFVPRLVAEPAAADALPLAQRRIQERGFDDIASLDANYLRRTDAEIFAKPRAAKTSEIASQIASPERSPQ